MLYDPWLEPWLPLILQHAGDSTILEIGCGSGADTAVMAAAGLKVLAFDLSPQAIAKAQALVSSAQFLVRDTRDDFPVALNSTQVVIASLSLHYFTWRETVALFERVQQTLLPGGLFVCRLNSTQDINFGAAGHPAVEDNYFLVDGEPKRFFDREAVDAIFRRGWKIISLEHRVTDKYIQQKSLWEIVCTQGT
jgi:SAM-dependent methyltransferase